MARLRAPSSMRRSQLNAVLGRPLSERGLDLARPRLDHRGTKVSSREERLHLSPGGRYLIDEAFFKAASVSSTVSKAVVCMELRAPPALIASAVAAIATLSGASHKLYPSCSPKAYQKPCNFPPTASMYCLAAARRSSGFLRSFAHVSGV